MLLKLPPPEDTDQFTEPPGVVVEATVTVMKVCDRILTDDGVLVAEVVGYFTTCEIGCELLDAKFELPTYFATIPCDPELSDDVVNVATPLDDNVPEPSIVKPSVKFTLPVGTIVPVVIFTAAVNVTD